MDILKGIEHMVSQKYKLYVYVSANDEEEVILEKVKETLLQIGIAGRCDFEVLRTRHIKPNQLVFTVLPLYKLFGYN